MKNDIIKDLKLLTIIIGLLSLLAQQYFFVALCIISYILIRYANTPNMQQNNSQNEPIIKPLTNYKKKIFLTPTEKKFYNTLKEINNEYIVFPQINLASIIDKTNSRYRNELFRNIDFGIFNTNFELLLLIELNDNTHNYIRRKDRDLKVKKILAECNIPLLTFYTCYPNEKDYVLNRIYQTILSTETPLKNEVVNEKQDNPYSTSN